MFNFDLALDKIIIFHNGHNKTRRRILPVINFGFDDLEDDSTLTGAGRLLRKKS